MCLYEPGPFALGGGSVVPATRTDWPRQSRDLKHYCCQRVSNIWICETSAPTEPDDRPRPTEPEVFLCERKHTRVCARHDLALHDGVFMGKLTPRRFCTRPAGLQLYTSCARSHFLLSIQPASQSLHNTTRRKPGLWHRSCEELQGGTTGPGTSCGPREAELSSLGVSTSPPRVD